MAPPRDAWTERRGPSRRALLVGGGIGVGLVLAWAAWPRTYPANLRAAPGEQVFGPWLKIGEDGHIAVIVPQAETGRGATTLLPQILADELGADWRTIAVEPAPFSPTYANRLAPDTFFAGALGLPESWAGPVATRIGLMVSDDVDPVAAFEQPLRQAGAAARALLQQAAAKRWDIDWQACTTEAGLVRWGEETLRFGALAAEAASESVPDPLVMRGGGDARLTGQSLPRLDLPAKVDGSANFAADIRLPGMVFASVRTGPLGDSRLVRVDEKAAERIPGMRKVVRNDRWVAAVADNWWAANRALDALAPRFETTGGVIDDAAIDTLLEQGFAGDGQRLVATGDVAASFASGRVFTAEYRAAPSLHAAAEPMAATASWAGGRLELWLPTQVPAIARDVAAVALGIGSGEVTVHPMLVGGPDGSKFDVQVAAQAALLARKLERPVQLSWSRVEDLLHVPPRAPARARFGARLAASGRIEAWQMKLASPASGRLLADAFAPTLPLAGRGADSYALAGTALPYAVSNVAIDHHPVALPFATGHMLAGAHATNAHFVECFVDELAREAGIEPLSFRIAMLGGNTRLARCLQQVAIAGGWDGGGAGSSMGIACHQMRGASIAVLAEAAIDKAQRVRVARLFAVVDCGRHPHPGIALQTIESGLLFGVAQAIGSGAAYESNLPTTRNLGALGQPRLADAPELRIEFLPGGRRSAIGDLGVPAVAPAIANALRAATGRRFRSLPIDIA